MKEKEESTKKELINIEAGNISDIVLKIMVTRMLEELSDNYKGLSDNYISIGNGHRHHD